jgi:hypothetical protein
MRKQQKQPEISDEDAARVAEITRLGLLGMQYEGAAAFCKRQARILCIDDPNVRDHLLRLETADLHDKFNEEFVNDIGDFREVPLGIVGGEGANDALTRAARRKELEAEKRLLTEDEAYRRMLEAKAILGTEAEKSEAYTELAKLDGGNDPIDIEP